MRKAFLAAFVALALMLSSVGAANASSFLSLSNGSTTVSCDNSAPFTSTNCGAGFTTSANSNTISFTGTVGGYDVLLVKPLGNQPGTPGQAFILDTKTQIQNVSAGTSALTVQFAANNFLLPLGSPLTLSASQSGTFTTSLAGDQQQFTAYGNSANTLVPTGVPNTAPPCINPNSTPPAGVQACSSASIPTTFTRSGPFALAGTEIINLAQGDIASFTATSTAQGTACTGTIGDFVWNDLNHDGIQDAGEPGIPGVTVTLGGQSSATTTTDANGFYMFTGLCAGDYTVTVTPPGGGFIATTTGQGTPSTDSNPNPSTVNLPTNNSNDLTIDFGFYVPCTGMIGDFVWNDLNENGIQETGEPGIPGVVVTLWNFDHTVILASIVTDSSGIYTFSGLCAGTYQVEVTPPGGYNGSPYHIGQPELDSDYNGSPVVVTLPTNNTQNLTIDFGFFIRNPHIRITKSSDTFVQGAQVSFTIVATNDGNTILTNAHITDQLPGNGGLQWQTYTTTKGICTLSLSNFLDCQAGTLAVGESVTIKVFSSNPTPANACTLQPNPNVHVSTAEGASADASGSLSCTPVPSTGTATGAGFPWNWTTGAPSVWFMYSPWVQTKVNGITKPGISPSGIDLVTGKDNKLAGRITGTRGSGANSTALTITLNSKYAFSGSTDNVKINPMACTNNQPYVQPGQFTIHRVAAVTATSITVTGLPNTACYGIHVDVVPK